MGNGCLYSILDICGPSRGMREEAAYAACKGDVLRLRHLLEHHGVEVNYRFECKRTLLHFACTADQLEVVKYLVNDAGADLEARSISGATPLMEAAEICACDIITFLLEAGADPDAQDTAGCTPLFFAADSTCSSWPRHIHACELLTRVSDPTPPIYDLSLFAEHPDAAEDDFLYLWRRLHDKRRRIAFLQGSLAQTRPHPLFRARLFDRNLLKEIFQYI